MEQETPNQDNLPAGNDPITPEEALQAQYLTFMQGYASDSKSIMTNLRHMAVQLNSLDGNQAQVYAEKAKQLRDTLNLMIKLKKTDLEAFHVFVKIFGLEKNGEQSPVSDKSSNQGSAGRLLD